MKSNDAFLHCTMEPGFAETAGGDGISKSMPFIGELVAEATELGRCGMCLVDLSSVQTALVPVYIRRSAI